MRGRASWIARAAASSACAGSLILRVRRTASLGACPSGESDAEAPTRPLTREVPDGAIKVDIPGVQQRDDYSCGAAALMAVGSYFGVGPDDLEEYKKKLGTNEENGTNVYEILKYARELGLDPLDLRVRVGHVDLLFTSEALNLADLYRLTPNLARKPAVVYFHSNELPEPGVVSVNPALDYANMNTAAAATEIWFNSKFHVRMFLAGVNALISANTDAVCLPSMSGPLSGVATSRYPVSAAPWKAMPVPVVAADSLPRASCFQAAPMS